MTLLVNMHLTLCFFFKEMHLAWSDSLLAKKCVLYYYYIVVEYENSMAKEASFFPH